MAVSDPQQFIQQQITRKRWEFWCKLPERLSALADGESRVFAEPDPVPALETLHQYLHQLVGSAGTLGQETLGHEARRYEQLIKGLLANMPDLSASELQRLKSMVSALSAAVVEPESGEKPARTMSGVGLRRAPIWVLEPDSDAFSELHRQLSPFNYRLHHITAPSEAVEEGEAWPPLVIMNLSAYHRDPEKRACLRDFCRRMEARGVQLLFLADEDRFELRVFAAQQLAVGFVLQPVSVPRLTARIDRALMHQSASPGKVLIVEDDRELAEHYRLVLEAAGMRAKVLSGPELLMEELERFVPELVLMDLHMPRYSGTELAAVVRQYERWESLPIVYLSAETDMAAQIRAMRFGADDFLSKPVADAQLVAAIRARIERARRLSEQITRDGLTGLLRHASVKELAAQEIRRAKRDQNALSIAIIDIDHFKRVNDTYGHPVGDLVISSLAMLLKQRVRQADIVGRYGGEEFVIVLPKCNRPCAVTVIDNIRALFSRIDFDHEGRGFHCTLSAGVAALEEVPDADVEHLVALADTALYKAKNGGRNQVV